MRRVVTGQDNAGNSRVVNDGTPPRTCSFESLQGFSSSVVWGTEADGEPDRTGADVTHGIRSVVPGPGATRLLTLVFPPESVRSEPDFDGQALGEEFLAALPGLAELFAPDGVHVTPTVDYVFVMEGEIWLETDDGVLTSVKAGDVVIQNATRHAWRNLSDTEAVLAVVLVGV
ncbi:hypothetical protein XU06_29305 (plasmid) [Rhodococcus erythropolis]|uniref:cupin domain-containing protein n=1 Tax=Rhodococcus erythropolis TaxID=1833 RepID=UPI00061B86A7|nr:cupin domain-containing protein [Rhodococcus erythropolis]AKE01082.1 hypothetical protein XU06_29305 [Rhodococcus erythropolis]